MNRPGWARICLAVAVCTAGCQCGDDAPRGGQMKGERPKEAREHAVASAAGAALRAAIGDLDGDGVSEVVLVDAEVLRVIDRSGAERARMSAPGGIQVLELSDIDGDGRAEILAGWGLTSARLDAAASAAVYRLANNQLIAEQIAIPASERAQVAAIVPQATGAAPELLVAYYESKYMVRAARATRRDDTWTLSNGPQLRMATSWARGDVNGDGAAELVVGRVYGDARGTDGDAFVLGEQGERTAIPTTRGVRGLALADLDGDGTEEILLGDGWHANYGREARALLTVARADKDGFRSEVLDSGAGQYTVWDILPADLDGDGQLEIVTRGSHQVRVHSRTPTGWQSQVVAGESRDVAIGEIDGVPGLDILVLGDPSVVLSWRPR